MLSVPLSFEKRMQPDSTDRGGEAIGWHYKLEVMKYWVVVCIKANLASNQTVPLSFLNSTATIAHLSTFKHISLLC